MKTIEDAKALLDFMRSEGLRFARVGEVALELGDVSIAADQVEFEGHRHRRYAAIEDEPDLFGGDPPAFSSVEVES